MTIHVNWDGTTHPGNKTNENEDHFLLADLRKTLRVEKTSLPPDAGDWFYGSAQRRLMLVSDGLSGQPEGEKAGRLAAAEISRYVVNILPWYFMLHEDEEDDLAGDLRRAMESAHAQVNLHHLGEKPVDRMAVSITLGFLIWPRLFVVHAGHTRGYVRRSGKIHQITTDHTVAAHLADEGLIDETDVGENPWNRVLWKTVGGEDHEVAAEVRKLVLRPGDDVLLCTDGLYRLIGDGDIAEILEEHAAAEDATKALVESALAHGGEDNVTAALMRIAP